MPALTMGFVSPPHRLWILRKAFGETVVKTQWTGLVSLVSQLQRSCQSQETSMPQASVDYTGHDATEVSTCLAGESVTSVALEMPHMVEGQHRFLPNLLRNTKQPDQVRP